MDSRLRQSSERGNQDNEVELEEMNDDLIEHEIAEEIETTGDIIRFSDVDETWELTPTPEQLEPLPPEAFLEERRRMNKFSQQDTKYKEDIQRARERYMRYKRELSSRRAGLAPLSKKGGRGPNRPDTKLPPNGKRVKLKWSETKVPIGKFGNYFCNYLGILAKRADLWNVYLTWPNQPFRSFRDTWRNLQRHFIMDEPNAWHFVFTTINKMLNEWRSTVKSENYLPETKSEFDRFYYKDPRVEPIQFAALMEYWETDEFKKKSNSAKENRKKKVMDHHSGSSSFANKYVKLGKRLKRTPNVADKAEFLYGDRNGTRPISRKVKSTVDAITLSVKEAHLRHGLSNTEELPSHIQDECVDSVLGKTKTDRWRFAGRGALKPGTSNESLSSFAREQQTNDANVREIMVKQQNELSKHKEMSANIIAEQQAKLERCKDKSKKLWELLLDTFPEKRDMLSKFSFDDLEDTAEDIFGSSSAQDLGQG